MFLVRWSGFQMYVSPCGMEEYRDINFWRHSAVKAAGPRNLAQTAAVPLLVGGATVRLGVTAAAPHGELN